MLGRLGYEFYLKEPDKEVGRSRDTGGPKRCGTCGIVRSAQSADRVSRKTVLAVCFDVVERTQREGRSRRRRCFCLFDGKGCATRQAEELPVVVYK